MKIRLYPKGYDPMVASGACPRSSFLMKADISWTAEDTIKHKELEQQIIEIDLQSEVQVPTGQWYMIIRS